MGMESINPATEEVAHRYDVHPSPEVTRLLEDAEAGFEQWREYRLKERATILWAVASALRDQRDALARLIVTEMGKPLSQALGEIDKCAWVCEYYSEKAPAFLESLPIATEAEESYACYRPLGVLLAIMPWNFPFWQVFRAVAPATMAGNSVVLKHASNVSGCALAIQTLFQTVNAPKGLFSTLLVGSEQIPQVIEHPAVQAVTLTGSEQAGRMVASKAGQELKKSVMELGGSDPYVVLEDADLEKTVTTCVTSRLINSGQSCIAAKRFIVQASRFHDFVDLMAKQMAEASIGDPMQDETRVGPLARADLREELHRQVSSSCEKGAECVIGGRPVDRKGYYYEPTVLTNVQAGMPVYDEETFGPVAAVIKARDEREAIEIANDTRFGLGAAVFTADREKGEHIAANDLNAGCCFVNDFVKSDPRLPFGGVKRSGYGRELSEFGIREFVNIKTVVCR